jgi:hypothetical protein
MPRSPLLTSAFETRISFKPPTTFGADCPGVETVAVLSAFRLKALRLTVVKFLNRPLNMPPPPPCECEGAAGVDGGALGRGDSSKS